MLGCSCLIFGGRPGLLFAGSATSDVFDTIERDGLSRWMESGFLSLDFAPLDSVWVFYSSESCLNLFSGEDSWSESGLISRSSLVGLRGRKPSGKDLRFQGVELALRTLVARL